MPKTGASLSPRTQIQPQNYFSPGPAGNSPSLSPLYSSSLFSFKDSFISEVFLCWEMLLPLHPIPLTASFFPRVSILEKSPGQVPSLLHSSPDPTPKSPDFFFHPPPPPNRFSALFEGRICHPFSQGSAHCLAQSKDLINACWLHLRDFFTGRPHLAITKIVWQK